MFWKKSPKSDKPEQSQSLNNVSVTGGMVQLGQAGGDLQQEQTGDVQAESQTITSVEVLNLLENLEAAVKAAAIDPAQQEELLDYLRPAKREVAKENPQKELVGQNLKRVNETMQTLKDTTEAGKSLWQTGTEVFKAVAPWLGVVATAFFGL